MLDYFCIFTKGGALLWTWELTALRGSPVEALIRTCLLEERSGERSFSYKPPTGAAYTLKWSFDNSLGLVFVAVYQSALKLLYVEELLASAKAAFALHFQPKKHDYAGFEAAFKRALERAESRDFSRQPTRGQAAAAGAGASAGGLTQRKGGRRAGAAGGGDDSQPVSSEDSEDAEADTTDASRQTSRQPSAADFAALAISADESQGNGGSSPPAEPADGAFDVSKIKGKLAKRPPKGVGAAKREKAAKDAAKEAAKDGKKPKKVARKWGAGGSDKEEGPLDFSERPEGASGSEAEGGPGAATADLSKASLVDAAEESGDEPEEEPALPAPGQAPKQGFLSRFASSVSMSLQGKPALERSDIAAALDDLKRKLMERNVAEAIAAKLCESVASTLVGQRLESFSSVAGKVKAALEAALTRILTPRRSIDILREVQAARARGKPYTIVFVGVNGVGKSTNLSKVAYWLLQNDVKVMIAACDTFRSGAVEQLKTHCNRLGIPLYERGYEKDPAKVAHEAALQAARSKIDVLLVDTAGRMQDNEPLMRALSNLIALNEPELVLFVGEALVGNDAVDQLTKFNQRLLDLAAGPKAHAIDGILLTKFDTIDDKVGAALSMVYASGAPIMFVGVGQTYVDLKRLEVKSVVRSLLKD